MSQKTYKGAINKYYTNFREIVRRIRAKLIEYGPIHNLQAINIKLLSYDQRVHSKVAKIRK